MNAIDGVTENRSHGEWPYASWGINRQDDAKIRLDFGRPVEVDTIVLYTRADFPHDNWWVDGRITFPMAAGCSFPWKNQSFLIRLPLIRKQLPGWKWEI